MHIRTQLRKKVKEVLKAQKIRAFDPLFGTLSENEIPCVVVEIINVNTDPGTVMGAWRKEFLLSLSIVHKAFQGVDDVIDEIMAKTEKALLNDSSFKGKLIPLQEKIRENKEGDQSIRVVEQSFTYTIFTTDCEEVI